MIRVIKETNVLNEFDEDIWIGVIDKVILYKDKRKFTFKGGIEIEL